jgi:hypothetical protein
MENQKPVPWKVQGLLIVREGTGQTNRPRRSLDLSYVGVLILENRSDRGSHQLMPGHAARFGNAF